MICKDICGTFFGNNYLDEMRRSHIVKLFNMWATLNVYVKHCLYKYQVLN